MVDAGLTTHIDAVANVRGKVAGRTPDAPILLSGSHYDTVKDAGRFDGILGVIVPIASPQGSPGPGEIAHKIHQAQRLGHLYTSQVQDAIEQSGRFTDS